MLQFNTDHEEEKKVEKKIFAAMLQCLCSDAPFKNIWHDSIWNCNPTMHLIIYVW